MEFHIQKASTSHTRVSSQLVQTTLKPLVLIQNTDSFSLDNFDDLSRWFITIRAWLILNEGQNPSDKADQLWKQVTSRIHAEYILVEHEYGSSDEKWERFLDVYLFVFE